VVVKSTLFVGYECNDNIMVRLVPLSSLMARLTFPARRLKFVYAHLGTKFHKMRKRSEKNALNCIQRRDDETVGRATDHPHYGDNIETMVLFELGPAAVATRGVLQINMLNAIY
jgi:hypothetical protein